MNPMDTFGRNLKQLIEKELGLKIHAVARQIDLDYPLLNKVCNGINSPTLETLNKLMRHEGLRDFVKPYKEAKLKAELFNLVNQNGVEQVEETLEILKSQALDEETHSLLLQLRKAK